MKKQVYGYIRVSTETQADKGYGLETQQAAIEKYCLENDLDLKNIFIDAGISGALGDKDDLTYREGLTDLLATLNGTNTIVVMNTSRLWRDDSARVMICRQVRKLNGEIISVEQPKYSLYSNDPQDFLYNSMMEMLDQYERLTINLRLAKGRTTKANKGYKPCGNTPFGYKWDKESKLVVVESEESKIIKDIFNLASTKHGFQDIANKLNNKNVKNRRGNKWSKQSIRAILQNKYYIGILNHQGQEIQGKHQALISKDIWSEIYN